MAAKICALLVLLALSASAATAFFSPQCSANIPQYYLPHLTALGYGNPIVQSNRLQQALMASILSSPAMFLQQYQSALLQQLSLAHLILQNIMAQQQVLSPFSQLALASPASYYQQQQLLPFNQLAVANAYLQQQLLPFNPLAIGNPNAFWQQQQLLPFTPLAISNPAALWQQQQLLRGNPFYAMNPAAFWQRQLLSVNPVAAMNPAAFWQLQLLHVNPLAAMNPSALLQQPIVGCGLF